MTRPRLLISPMDVEEARECVEGGADIIDVKNPREGSLGANFPWIIKAIRRAVPMEIEVSATIGDFPDLPGSASLAALGVATTGVNYVKVGLFGSRTEEAAIFLMKQVVRAVKDYNSRIKVVAAGYADAKRVGTIDPLKIPSIVASSNADIAMVDTALKDGRSLFDFLTPEEIEKFTSKARELGLKVALAGSIKREEIAKAASFKPDVIGIRGAACSSGNRNGRIEARRVRELLEILKHH
ncbi:MAG: (5-formylfuran-3-yl)methyl phosphate synthase [Methanocellales archaeon]